MMCCYINVHFQGQRFKHKSRFLEKGMYGKCYEFILMFKVLSC